MEEALTGAMFYGTDGLKAGLADQLYTTMEATVVTYLLPEEYVMNFINF